EQVVVNLLDNALKFSADNSLVEVEVAVHPSSGAAGKGNGALPAGRRRKSNGDAGSQRSETGAGTLCLAVRDHGIGVAPQDRRRLFERFYQAHARDYRSGLGLGLYICRRIVELHGGTITAEFPVDGGT